VVAALYILQRRAEDPSRRFLFLQHTEELLDQNLKTIAAITGLSTSIVMAKQNDWSGDVVFASVPTLGREKRLAELGKFTDLIIDECHHSAAASWERIITKAQKKNPKLRVLGLSATPDRGDGQPLPKALGPIVYRIYIQELIDEGHLVAPRAYSVNLGANKRIEGVGLVGGDVDHAEVAKILDTPEYNAQIVAQWKGRARHRPTVAFCSTAEHAASVAAAFQAAGVVARALDYNTPKDERREIIAAFKRGEIQVLTNCLLLTEGFDYQPTSCVIILRAMIHCSTFIQALGRGMRVVDAEKHPGIIKTDMICLDFAGAAARHSELDTKTYLPLEDVDLTKDPEEEAAQAEELPLEAANDDEPDEPFVPVLQEIDLAVSQFRWTDIHRNGTTLLVSGLAGFAAVLRAGENWASVGREKGGKLHVLHMGTRHHAYAAACDYIRKIEKDDRAVGNRRWLNDPLSRGQRDALTRMGYQEDDLSLMNKYEGSCHITYMAERSKVKEEVGRHLRLAREAMTREAA
jgi:superfamily II DNA or RNA helicase